MERRLDIARNLFCIPQANVCRRTGQWWTLCYPLRMPVHRLTVNPLHHLTRASS